MQPGSHVTDLPTPVLVLDEVALDHNIAAMAAWVDVRGVLLAPHGKTTMCPPLFRRQLDAGAFGMTVADVRGGELAVDAGAKVVLIANELANPSDYDWIAACNDATRILFLLDSAAGLEAAEAAHRRLGGQPFEVLLEVGFAGGRCGVRELEDAVSLADAIASSPHVDLAGVEAFEGLLADLPAVDEFLDRVGDVAEAVTSRLQSATPLLTCGGSSFFDRVVERLGARAEAGGYSLVLRSGCYVTHDHGLYAERTPSARAVAGAPRFMSAITVRATVLSRPEETRAIVNAGRRHVSFDAGLPTVLHVERGGAILIDEPAPVVVTLSDQHAHLQVADGASLRVGDVVVLGISHPCTAIDRWRVMPLIGDNGAVIDSLPTYF